MRLDGRVQVIVSSRWQRPTIIGAPIVTRSIETDYLVVGAGAMGMAFTDALIDNADVHVTLVDQRHAAGGHWQDAYLSSSFTRRRFSWGCVYGLGTGTIQRDRRLACRRARQSEIQSYYDEILIADPRLRP
jgi:hypothetical protein